MAADNPKLGVELEVGYDSIDDWHNGNKDSRTVYPILNSLTPGKWTETEDGGGIEFQFPPFPLVWYKDNRAVFKKFLNYVKRTDNEFDAANDEAGMHVHIDINGFTQKSFMLMLEFMAAQNNFFFTVSRRTRTHYYTGQGCFCLEKPDRAELIKYNTDNLTKAFNRKDNLYSADTGFLAVYRKKYPTIEFRMFNSTDDYIVFLGNVQFVHSLWNYFNNVKDAGTELEPYLQFVMSKKLTYKELIKSLKALNIELPKAKRKKTVTTPKTKKITNRFIRSKAA